MSLLIEWKESYAIGIPEVDHEHREMIALINELYDALRAGADSEELQTFLAEVHVRIAAHFALEERVMRDIGYDEYAQHKAEHERLLDDILDLMDACAGSKDLDAAALSRRLDEWFSVHFRTCDARLHRATG